MMRITVLDLEPEAVYRETVYDQTVIAQCKDGTVINIFDISATINKKDIGKSLDVSIYVDVFGSVSILEDINQSSHPSIGFHIGGNGSSKWSYDIVGEIGSIQFENNVVLLKVADGDISIGMNKFVKEQLEDRSASVGDFLFINSGRIDLMNVSRQ